MKTASDSRSPLSLCLFLEFQTTRHMDAGHTQKIERYYLTVYRQTHSHATHYANTHHFPSLSSSAAFSESSSFHSSRGTAANHGVPLPAMSKSRPVDMCAKSCPLFRCASAQHDCVDSVHVISRVGLLRAEVVQGLAVAGLTRNMNVHRVSIG